MPEQLPIPDDAYTLITRADTIGGNFFARVVSSNTMERPSQVARHLYDLGLNVIPLPKPDAVAAWAAEKSSQRNPKDKRPYLIREFFYNRIHVCNDVDCGHVTDSGRKCLHDGATFAALFHNNNIGMVLGRTSRNMLAIDAETPTAAATIRHHLAQHDIHYWEYSTHRGSGFLVRVAEGEVANIKLGQCAIDDVEVHGNNRYVVIPPSLHPEGTFYDWQNVNPMDMSALPTPVSIAQLDWLGATLNTDRSQETPTRPTFELFGLPHWAECLSLRNRQALGVGVEKGRRYNTFLAIARDMAGNEIDIKDATAAAQYYCEICSPQWNMGEATKALTWAYSVANDKARDNATTRASANNYELMLSAVSQIDWRGQRAKNERAIMLAIIERAKMEAAKPIFRASVREVAELAGVTKNTTAAALKRFCDSSNDTTPTTLRLVGKCPTSKASLYQFNFEGLRDWYTITNYLPYGVPNSQPMRQHPSNPSTTPLQDVFKGKRVAWLIYTSLQEAMQPSRKALAAALGYKHQSSISRPLSWLFSHGLIGTDGEGFLYAIMADTGKLNGIAYANGTLGKTERQKRQHQRQREREATLKLANVVAGWRDRTRQHAEYLARTSNTEACVEDPIETPTALPTADITTAVDEVEVEVVAVGRTSRQTDVIELHGSPSLPDECLRDPEFMAWFDDIGRHGHWRDD